MIPKFAIPGLAIGFLAAAGLLLVGGTSASAAPGSGASQFTGTLICNGEPLTVTSTERGRWSAFQVIGVNGSPLVLYGFNVNATDLDTGETLFSGSFTKPGDRPGETVTCTAHNEFIDDESGHHIARDVTFVVIQHGVP